jgi:excisionase family DNA binding protein
VTENGYLNTAEALAYLRTTQRTLYRLLATGKIPAVRIGHQWRFRKTDLDRWVEERAGRLPLPKNGPAVVAASRARRVLVADDEAGVREILTSILAMTGCEIDAVPDGVEALARLRTYSYDLVITDLRMPGMEGIELAQQAKRLWPAVKIILITGYPTQSSAIDAVNIGVDGYLTKPFHPMDVLIATARVLELGSATMGLSNTGCPN